MDREIDREIDYVLESSRQHLVTMTNFIEAIMHYTIKRVQDSSSPKESSTVIPVVNHEPEKESSTTAQPIPDMNHEPEKESSNTEQPSLGMNHELEEESTTTTVEQQSPTNKKKPFSESIKNFRTADSLDVNFVKFFDEGCLEGWEREKGTKEFKSRALIEKRSLSCQYKRWKDLVKILLFFSDKFPPPRPKKSCEVKLWRQQVAAIAERALQRLYESLPDYPRRSLHSNRLKKLYIVEQWNKNKKFPQDTPVEMLIYFGVTK